MNDRSRTKEQLIAELSEMRQKNNILKESLSLRNSGEALWESEQKYRLLIENSHDIIYTLSSKGIFTFVSPSWTALLGHEVNQVVGKQFQEFVHPDDIDVCVAFQKKVVKTGQPQSGVEYRVRHFDGSWRWHTSNGAPLRDEAGSIISFEGIAGDITDRKRAEEALKESQQQYSDIINFLPDATFVIDKEGKVITWNKAIEEMTGVKAPDIVGKDNYEYALAFYGERRPILIDLVLHPRKDIEAKYVRTERGDVFMEAETRIPCFRGKEIFLFGKANILRDSKGNIVGAIESIRNITIRKKAEEALKYSEERFSKAFHMNPVPVIICTIDDGRYVDVNESFLRMLNYKREDMIGKTPGELGTWVYSADQKRIALKLRDQGFLKDEKLRLRGSTNEIRELRVSAEVIVLNENKLVLCIFYDITDQERLESQKRQTQKMEAIGTLAGGIAHDFNNILGAVMGYAEMALEESITDNHFRFYLEQIFTACERARDLVKQILTFSRKSDEKVLPLPVQVGSVIKEVLKLLRASLPSTIKIELDIEPGPDTILADPTQIHQILMNLCTNAAYAMPEKKGELKISLTSEEIKKGSPYNLMPG
ncbi:MAG: PAS domain S-box protein, partial [Smithella sp.]